MANDYSVRSNEFLATVPQGSGLAYELACDLLDTRAMLLEARAALERERWPQPPGPEVRERVVWVVAPHEDGEFDECWLPGETEEHHEAAINYARDRLDEAWDQSGPDERRAVVRIEQRWVSEADFAALDESEHETPNP